MVWSFQCQPSRMSTRTSVFEKKQGYCSKRVVVHLSRKLERCLTKQGKIRIPLSPDRNTKRVNVVNLLLITRGKKKHYTATKNLSRVLSRRYAVSRRACSYCLNCLNGFRTISARDKNYANCVDHNAVQIEMSWKEEDKGIEYHKEKIQFRVPFTMHSDFTSLSKTLKAEEKDEKEKSWWLILKVYYRLETKYSIKHLGTRRGEQPIYRENKPAFIIRMVSLASIEGVLS